MGKLIEKLSTWTRGFKVSESRTGGMFSINESASGREVGPTEALTLSAIFCGVRLLSEVIGMLPLTVYQQNPDGTKHPALNEPAYSLLHSAPNPWMTAKTFRGTLEFHRRLWGNAYAEIRWTMGGQAMELWPIEPWRVQPKLIDGDLKYVLDGDGRNPINKEDMLHVPLVTFNGVVGKSFVDFAIDSLGLSLSAQDFASEFFANGGMPGDILTGEGPKAFEYRDKIREGWEQRHQGKGKRHRTGVLWGGWKWESAGGVDPEKAQALESRRFGVEEAARLLGMPPHLLRDLARATFSNIEEQGIDAVVYTWQPVAVDYEQEYNRKLLDPPKTFAKHNLNGLMRGNSAARSTFYKELFQVAGITANRILELEDENPIGPIGDLRFVPLNMQTLQEAQRKSEAPPAPEPAPQPPADVPPAEDDVPADPGLTARLWMQDTLERLMRKELNQIRRAAAQPANFLVWMETFYEGYQAVLAQAVTPVSKAHRFTDSASNIAHLWVECSRRELLELSGDVTPAKFPAAIQSLAAKWEANRVAQTVERLMELSSCQN